MTLQEIKQKVESTKCTVHKEHPSLVFSADRVKNLKCCCDQFRVNTGLYLDALFDQMDEEIFASAEGPVVMTEGQFERARNFILHLKELIEQAKAIIGDETRCPQQIYKMDIDYATHAYERIAHSNRAGDELLSDRVQVLEEAENLKPLIAKARQAYDKYQRRLRREEERANNALKRERELEVSYKNSIWYINHLKEVIENARKALDKPSRYPGSFEASVILYAKNAYERIERMGRGTPELLAERDEVIAEAERLRALVVRAQREYEERRRALEAIEEKRRQDRIEKEQEKEKAKEKERFIRERDALKARREKEIAEFVAAQRKREEEKEKKKEKERKKRETAQRRLEEKEKREQAKFIEKNLPKWVKSLVTAQHFVEEYFSKSRLESLSKENLQKVVDICIALQSSIGPLNALQEDKYTDLRQAYIVASDNLHKILIICDEIRNSKSKTSQSRKRTYEKQRENKREDSPYFRKMFRLYESKPNASDKWYENESRRFYVNRHEDVHDYLSAFGRIVRGNIKSAEIVVDGKEDVDEWGYLVLENKLLPYCLHIVRAVHDTMEYHLYTFNTVSSIDGYDYDDAITERLFLLRDKGIKTDKY